MRFSVLSSVAVLIGALLLGSTVSFAGDEDLPVKIIAARWFTVDDGKDGGDGISETYLRMPERKIIAHNTSWGKPDTYDKGSWTYGQTFDISAENIALKDISKVQYEFAMDDENGWNVVMYMIATMPNGAEYEVGRQLCNIGDHLHVHNGRFGNVPLKFGPRPLLPMNLKSLKPVAASLKPAAASKQ